MRIVFVRHGEPDYARDCLTELGRAQAKTAAVRLKDEGIEEIWSSPLGRALETANAAAEALGLPVQTLDFMREVTWGSVDGTQIFAGGHPWAIVDEMVRQGIPLNSPGWRDFPFFQNNRVLACVDSVERGIDEWLKQYGTAMFATVPTIATRSRNRRLARLRFSATAVLPPRPWGIS